MRSADLQTSPTPRLLREARALARPVLKAVQRGKISLEGFREARGDGRKRQHPLIEALARVLAAAPDYQRVKRLGIEKDGVLLAAGIAFKIGYRATVEADLYASNPDKHDILAECRELLPCVAVMERATPIRDLDYTKETRSELNAFYDSREQKRMNRFTCDAHDGNVGRTADGRWVLIDYSFDVEAPRNARTA